MGSLNMSISLENLRKRQTPSFSLDWAKYQASATSHNIDSKVSMQDLELHILAVQFEGENAQHLTILNGNLHGPCSQKSHGCDNVTTKLILHRHLVVMFFLFTRLTDFLVIPYPNKLKYL